MNTYALTSTVIALGIISCTAVWAADDSAPRTRAEVSAELMAAHANGQLALLGSVCSDHLVMLRCATAEPTLCRVGSDRPAATSLSDDASQANNPRCRPRCSSPQAVRHSR